MIPYQVAVASRIHYHGMVVLLKAKVIMIRFVTNSSDCCSFATLRGASMRPENALSRLTAPV